ncbi:MAG: UvrD-helicase domain-containing protein [Herminiimonas sp.]|nr:UvrD-helicase domain-containing protein [Herminiimonas sp.]
MVSGLPLAARAYEVDGVPVAATAFIAAACDPAVSVVVEACAGSGKTWLLVARMLRLLLAGCEPSALLAITFTRKAAQEMQERLMQLLQELALAPPDQVALLLTERGVPSADVARLLPTARGLYGRILASPQALSIDTFHSWFARLLQIAPLASGVSHGYTLAEATGELLTEATNRFMESVNAVEAVEVRTALRTLYALAGDHQARKLLDAFVAQRAEWWAASQEAPPLDALLELCGIDGSVDARLGLWSDTHLQQRILRLAGLLGKGSDTNQKRAGAIEAALASAACVDTFEALFTQFFDASGTPRRNLATKALKAAIDAALGTDAWSLFEDEFNAVGASLLHLQARSHERSVVALNTALMTVGHAFLEQYQALKAERRVFDFADLEWHVYRLLGNAQHAAYLQSRLDARYRHVLLDEFQDTNPLQWNVVQGWLDAYGDDASRPSVFMVGDPKQSIYRFRRAEPRVFVAARQLLQAQGARILRTSQTRRNATAITDVLNAAFAANPLYFQQTTLASAGGAVWRLPLVQSAGPSDALTGERASTEGATVVSAGLRDPLTTAREEEEDARRLREGEAVAQALHAARAELDRTAQVGAAPCHWSDIMLLVKKRAHLAAYERALREAGIPFVSDKRGGLLESLEVSDLIALLTFLITPGDNLALAHVLKCPVFGAADADLLLLFQRSEPTWWLRLQAAAAETSPPPSLARAAHLLTLWRAAAPRLPVHDLLDIMLDQGEILARYAQAATALQRAQVIGNLHAFIELSLAMDAGRYPSLPRFIDALRVLQKSAQRDAPDEAATDTGVDAVRILTIHSAKGLEAPVVVVLDANHNQPAREDVGILCVWPQDAAAPTHFSAFGRRTERGFARNAYFEEEEKLRAQEDWNLLYVATTRARRLLIISGVADGRAGTPDGLVADSWYARLGAVPEQVTAAASVPTAASVDPTFELALFLPQQLPQSPPPATGAPDATVQETLGQAADEGILLHALMERITLRAEWPVPLPSVQMTARWLGCTPADADEVRAQAQGIVTQPLLQRFYDPARFVSAENELEVVAGGQLLRVDRLVRFEDAIWILDYKRSVGPDNLALHAPQLARYRRAVQSIGGGLPVYAALIAADGSFWPLS